MSLVRPQTSATPDFGELPHPDPRPDGEEEHLKRVWAAPTGWRIFSAINNTHIGLFYIGAALLFFVLAGILALLMRTQLAVPNNTFIPQELYNQLFTMHGTMMMFLFAVPVVEAVGVLLLPNMLGARDLPFPRLSAFAFWAYFVGGMIFFSSLFLGLAPSGGWFMYPPLTSGQYSPGINADFYLLGIGFIEISAIAGAIEIIVGIFKTRAPGMTLGRMPIFAWAMLVFAGMIIFAFPAVILATLLLELERAFGWPFFIADKGGDPLLWQHLFWFFGHPEVYIIFLPAAGMVSMILPTMTQTPLVAYKLIVVGLIATGFFSFGLWVHHMFTTGLPEIALGFFSAASMAVAIPSGIQVFAWIATIADGKLRLATPSLFILGFLFIFVLGGLTGVMVAIVPFDSQVHDTYFIVAHFHYVLIGGMVFPLFAAIYYWAPAYSENALSERLGKWAFGLMFAGFNIAFLPMHLTGLMGMPRRVYTYGEEMGWGAINLVSTCGAFIFALGVALVAYDLLRHFRFTFAGPVGDAWGAGSLEWLPNDTYGTRSIPRVASRDPLWEDPNFRRNVEGGHYYLPDAPTGGRETIVTSPIEAEPQYVLQMPRPGWAPFVAAVTLAFGFLCLTVKAAAPAMVLFTITVAGIAYWNWQLPPRPEKGPVNIGGGIVLPAYATGSVSHSWWAMAVLVLAAGALYLSYVFSYLYVWTVAPRAWPGATGQALPEISWPLMTAVLLVVSAAAMFLAGRVLRRGTAPRGVFSGLVVVAAVSLVAGTAVEIQGHWGAGSRPWENSYGALTYTASVLQVELAGALVVMALFLLARRWMGLLDWGRRAAFECTDLLWRYTVAQGLFGLLLVHGFPRAVA